MLLPTRRDLRVAELILPSFTLEGTNSKTFEMESAVIKYATEF